jgi:phosphoribosylanthranilate isomerase
MLRVKVCGITTVDDATLAVDLGASAIGLVFWPDSPRYVDASRAREIALALPTFVTTVGVFVDQGVEEVTSIADTVGLGAIQLHGNEQPADYTTARRRLIKAVAVRNGSAAAAAAAVPPFATLLLDAHDPIRRGGTGQRIDWTLAAAIARTRPTILSGGLNAENVAEAVERVAPYAIDVSSGVESSPGRKDVARLRAFFSALREP